MEYIARLATIQDIDELIDLRIRMQIEVNPGVEVAHNYSEKVREYLERRLEQSTYVSAVAEARGKLVSANGLIVYSKIPSIIGGSGKVGYITNVYTLPDWRGRGIASALMKLIVSYSRTNGLEKLHLGATDSGKGVYEGVDFKPPRYVQLELRL
jgi:ribosomal protein S18 acetylase RimI-like enzyme